MLKFYPLKKFSLQYGISVKKMYLLSQYLGSNPQNRQFKLRRFQNIFVRSKFDLVYYNKFKDIISNRFFFFWDIKIYRGIRHMLRMPVRGQRTHTNGKTKKKTKYL